MTAKINNRRLRNVRLIIWFCLRTPPDDPLVFSEDQRICSSRNPTASLTNQYCSIVDQTDSLSDQYCSSVDQTGSLSDQYCSSVDQTGSLTNQYCSLVDQKGSLTDRTASLTDRTCETSVRTAETSDRTSEKAVRTGAFIIRTCFRGIRNCYQIIRTDYLFNPNKYFFIPLVTFSCHNASIIISSCFTIYRERSKGHDYKSEAVSKGSTPPRIAMDTVSDDIRYSGNDTMRHSKPESSADNVLGVLTKSWYTINY